MALIKFDFLRY